MEETSGWISRIIIDFSAFDGWTAGKEFRSIEHQTQQFKKKRKKEHVHGGWSGGDGDTVLQRLYIEQQREDHPPVFATRGGGIGGVLFVVDVTSSGRIKSNKKKGRVCKIIVNVASRRWRKTKVKHGMDELNNEKMNK